MSVLDLLKSNLTEKYAHFSVKAQFYLETVVFLSNSSATVSHIFLQKLRASNVFTKEITKELI